MQLDDEAAERREVARKYGALRLELHPVAGLTRLEERLAAVKCVGGVSLEAPVVRVSRSAQHMHNS